MDYIIWASVAAVSISIFIAWAIMRIKLPYYLKVIGNLILLFVSVCLTIVTGIQETSLLVLIFLIVFTIFGIVVHYISVPVLNILGKFIAKINKQSFASMSYEQYIYDGNKMYFCVLSFVTIKIVLYVLLAFSLLNFI